MQVTTQSYIFQTPTEAELADGRETTAETIDRIGQRMLAEIRREAELSPYFNLILDEERYSASSYDRFIQKIKDYLADRADRRTVVMAITRGMANGVVSYLSFGVAAGVWEGAFSFSAMIANKDIGNGVNWGEKKFHGGGMAFITVIDISFLIGLMSFAALGPNPLNWGILQFTKTVVMGFLSRGILEWAIARHRTVEEIRAGIDRSQLPTDIKDKADLAPDVLKNLEKIESRYNQRAFAISVASVSMIALDLPKEAFDLGSLGLKAEHLPQFLDFLSHIEISTVGLSLLTATGAVYALWTIKQIAGTWKLALAEGWANAKELPVQLAQLPLRAFYGLAGFVDKRWLPAARCQALMLSL